MCSFECGNFAKKLHISEKSSTFVANLRQADWRLEIGDWKLESKPYY